MQCKVKSRTLTCQDCDCCLLRFYDEFVVKRLSLETVSGKMPPSSARVSASFSPNRAKEEARAGLFDNEPGKRVRVNVHMPGA